MKNATMLTILVLALMLCLVGVSQAAPMGTAFTYQGRLTEDDNPADALYDFQFRLFDASDEGSQIGNDVYLLEVDVIEGYFTVLLDFGSSVFNGDARWLQIGVRPSELEDPSEYTTLSPRQEVTPTPYALYAKTTGGDNDWMVSGDNMYAIPTGSVSIGTTLSGPKLRIQMPDGTSSGPSRVGGLLIEGGLYNEGMRLKVQDDLGNTRFAVDRAGRVGIGTESPSSGAALSVGRASAQPSIVASSDSNGGWLVMDSSGTGSAGVNYYTDGDVILAKGGGNVGVGTTTPTQKLHVAGTIRSSSGGFMFPDNSVQTTAATHWVSQGDSILNTNAANVGIGVAIPTSKLTVGGNIFVSTADGTIITPILQIIGGSDLSEQFDVRPDEKGVEPSAGMVVSIDPENPGELVVSSDGYDRKVAGIISGAGGIKPGMLMGQKGTVANGANPVALTGRVYCLADATNGSIQPGDLLTTSEMPGHAMKVTDYVRAQGAILGKAMTSLENGQGQVLVLVTLQ